MSAATSERMLGCLDRILRACDPAAALEDIAGAAHEIMGPGEVRLEWGRVRMGRAGDQGARWDVDTELALPGSRISGRLQWRSQGGSGERPDERSVSVLAAVAAAALSRLLPEAIEGAGGADEGDTGELGRRLRRAEQLAHLGRLAADIAHEINNPLTSILAFAQMLAEGGSGADASEPLAGLREQTLRCRRIASTLAAFSGRTEIHLRSTDLESLVTDVTLAVAARERASGLAIVSTPAERDCWIEADRDLLSEAVVNLIEGCVEVGHGRGGAGNRLEVQCRREGARVSLEILDGHGDTGSDATSASGAMLLRITAGIVAMHGGRLETRPARGTMVRVSFPASEGLAPLSRNEIYRQRGSRGP